MNNHTLKSVIAILFSLSLLACGESGIADKPSVRITTLTPPVVSTGATFQNLQGEPVELADYLGKKVVLNYWATWCAPCIREIPSLNRAAALLGNEEFVFLMASDESLEEINQFVTDHDFDGHFLKLNAFFSSFGVEAVPSTVLFDAQGQIINTWLGEYEWDSPRILGELTETE